jgi:small subunit ribosomal protein S17
MTEKKEVKEKKKDGRKGIGIDVSPPEAKCEDERCVWHGKLPVRGRVFEGVVRSSKAPMTIVVEWGYHKKNAKYQRYERRKSRVTAHRPPCMRPRDGDRVVIAECRPISKTKTFVMVGFAKGVKA